MPTVTLTLTDEQFNALTWEAVAFKTALDVRLLTILEPALSECIRRYRDTQWQTRRRTLDSDTELAAMIDRAGDW